MFQPIRHEKMDMPNSPCEKSINYNFGHCVEKFMIRMAGCQPPWRRVTVEDQPLCDNKALLARYSAQYWELGYLSREEISRRTKCPIPCSYMEFKVISGRVISRSCETVKSLIQCQCSMIILKKLLLVTRT